MSVNGTLSGDDVELTFNKFSISLTLLCWGVARSHCGGSTEAKRTRYCMHTGARETGAWLGETGGTLE